MLWYCRPNIDPRPWLTFPAATEWIGITKRSMGLCGSQFFWALGQAFLAVLIYFIRDWRLAQLVMAAPMGLVAVYIWRVWARCSSGRQGSHVMMIQGAPERERALEIYSWAISLNNNSTWMQFTIIINCELSFFLFLKL